MVSYEKPGPMIQVENLCKTFGDNKAVDRVSLKIPAGQITTIAGADGAGKSTIFRMLIGLVSKDSGTIFLKNRDIGNDYKKITSITGYMPERFSLYPDLSVEENLNFYADIHEIPFPVRESLKKRLLESTGMIQFKKRKANALSGGMKQKLALSAILLSAPELVILDEPTTGVDPLSRIEFFNIIKDLKGEGKTIFIATPYLDEAENSDNIIFIKKGQIIHAGSLHELRKNFPAKIYKILPRGNIYEIIEQCHRNAELRDSVYIRGKYLRYIQDSDKNPISLIPCRSMETESPKLEDIFLYYEKHSLDKDPEFHANHH